ncbi:Ubiquitin-conjugating enzyme E2 6 [Taxawa tesnikishii (nom. ined.)]|nr:Ubiquitin-conjugating enzyme E2 6 [Dothideales sp. JES 119]
MHTPSGRFQPSTRLCLSISDFHPKSFNPAWEVSTILLGLQSFMTSEEMTTGSLSGTEAERRVFAARTRCNGRGFGAIRNGDGGKKFREQWPELDEENWEWMEENKIDPVTGKTVAQTPAACSPEASALRKRPAGSQGGIGDVVERGQVARDAGQSWLARNKFYVVVAVIFAYVIAARLLGDPA